LRVSERESFDRDAKRTNEYSRDELRPFSNGAAIFDCSACPIASSALTEIARGLKE